MKKNRDLWKKFAAVSIVAALSAGLLYLMYFLSSLSSMREDIIERKNLGGILAEIKTSNVDIHALRIVLHESPRMLPLFISFIINTAFTVWLYHRILHLICKNPNQQK